MTDNVRVPLPLEYERRVRSLAGLLRWQRPEDLRLISALEDDEPPREVDVGDPAGALRDAASIVITTLRDRGIPCTREDASRAVLRHALSILGAGASA
jgi:hypothetical protein